MIGRNNVCIVPDTGRHDPVTRNEIGRQPPSDSKTNDARNAMRDRHS